MWFVCARYWDNDKISHIGMKYIRRLLVVRWSYRTSNVDYKIKKAVRERLLGI